MRDTVDHNPPLEGRHSRNLHRDVVETRRQRLYAYSTTKTFNVEKSENDKINSDSSAV